MTIFTEPRRRLMLGAAPYADDEPDAVEFVTIDPVDALRRIELEESFHD